MAVPLPVNLSPWLPKKPFRKVLGSWGGWAWVGVYTGSVLAASVAWAWSECLMAWQSLSNRTDCRLASPVRGTIAWAINQAL